MGVQHAGPENHSRVPLDGDVEFFFRAPSRTDTQVRVLGARFHDVECSGGQFLTSCFLLTLFSWSRDTSEVDAGSCFVLTNTQARCRRKGRARPPAQLL